MMLCLLALCGATAAPAPPAFFKPGWDPAVDPDKDCKFVKTKEKLTIELPGTAHDLGVTGKLMNAPRLLRDVRGDFRVDVRISGDWALSKESTVPKAAVYAGGALLIMVGDDAKEILRMEFARTAKDKLGLYAGFHYIDENGKYGGLHAMIPLVGGGKQLYLRCECQSNIIKCYYSADGRKWISWNPGMRYNVPKTAKPKVGLMAFSTSKNRSKVYFDQFNLTSLPKKP
jgi:hypothetical protein